jgi:fatty acid-binding protein DegV
MKWNIITDSSCDMKFDEFKFDNIRLAKVPFVITIDGKDYVDDDNLDVDNMLDIMEASSEAGRSACPSPITWYEQFEQADYCDARHHRKSQSRCNEGTDSFY